VIPPEVGLAGTTFELHFGDEALAHGLRTLGVRRGDRIGWLGADHPAFLAVDPEQPSLQLLAARRAA
jgi:hypothetical protein